MPPHRELLSSIQYNARHKQGMFICSLEEVLLITCSAFDSIFIVIEVIGNIRAEAFVSQIIYQ